MRDTKKKYTTLEDGRRRTTRGENLKPSTVKAIQDYKTEFIRETYRQFVLKINKQRYADVIKYLEEMDTVTPYVVELIRQDMLKKEKAARKAAAKAATSE